MHFVEGYICYVKDRIYEIMTLRRLCEFVVLYLPLRFSMDEIYIVGGWVDGLLNFSDRLALLDKDAEGREAPPRLLEF